MTTTPRPAGPRHVHAASAAACRMKVFDTLEEIAPAVAHDLRGPINTMSLQLELLGDGLASSAARDPQTARLARYADNLREELGRLHRGLEAFLAQIADPGGECWDATGAVSDVARLVAAVGRRRRIQVRTELPSAPWTVHGDRQSFRRGLLLLALDQLEALDGGGAIEIRRTDDRLEIGTEGPVAAPADRRFEPVAAALLDEAGIAVEPALRSDGRTEYALAFEPRRTPSDL